LVILLISTSRGIVKYDIHARNLQRVLPEISETYGISWTTDGKKLVVACTKALGHVLSFDDLAGYARSEVGTLACNGIHSPGCLSAPHQIVCVNDTYTLVANSGRNALARMRLDDWCLSMHRVDDVYWDRFDPTGKQGLHLNSVSYYDSVVYAVAHNFERGSRVFAFSWPDFTVLKSWNFSVGGMHNVAIVDGRLLVCDSLNGSLVAGLTGETLWSNGATGMTRGLAASEEHLFVGWSSFADRDNRANSSGGIWILERATLQAIECVDLPNLGGVNEIRIVDVPDSCHHGFVLNHPPVGTELQAPVMSSPETRINQCVQDFHASGWRIVCGTLEESPWSADQRIQVSQSGLLVVHVSAHCQQFISGTFDFARGADDVHASLILNYQGPGDTTMAAGMLRRTQAGLIASIWRHEAAWECLDTVVLTPPTGDLAQSYHVSFRIEAGQYMLFVDDRPYLQLPAQPGAKTPSGSVGVRLSGPGVSVRGLSTPVVNPPVFDQG